MADSTTPLLRTWKYLAFAPRDGIEAFQSAVLLKREMWADMCAMQEAHTARLAPLLAVPRAERDADAISVLRKERMAAIADIRRAYAARGLSWGDYNAVVFQFDGAVRASAARKALPRPDDEALGEAVVRQIMRGCLPHHLLSRDDVSIEYLPPTGAEKKRRRGSHRSGYRTARMTFYIRTARSPAGEAAMTLDFVMHRPLPVNAEIVEVRIIRRARPIITRSGEARTVSRWFVTFAVKLPRAEPQGRRVAGIAFDWRGDGDGGSNLATIADERGIRTIGWPASHADAWEASRASFAEADCEPDEAMRVVKLAEARIARRRLEDERRLELRRMAREAVEGTAAIGIEKSWLAGKGVKKFAAPALFRQEIVRAAENAGAVVVLVKSEISRAPSRNRAAAARKKAADALSVQRGALITEAAE